MGWEVCRIRKELETEQPDDSLEQRDGTKVDSLPPCRQSAGTCPATWQCGRWWCGKAGLRASDGIWSNCNDRIADHRQLDFRHPSGHDLER